MRIYLVQAGQSLTGSDGYSYRLLHGDQTRLLVSFVDFMRSGQQKIHGNNKLNRRKIIKRSPRRKPEP